MRDCMVINIGVLFTLPWTNQTHFYSEIKGISSAQLS